MGKQAEPTERQRDLRLMNLSTFRSIRFDKVEFDGEWRDLIGNPVLTGMWIMWGKSSNGKTSAAVKLLHYLTNFEKCIYWSKEEGVSDELQGAMERVLWSSSQEKKVFIPQNSWKLDDLKKHLRTPKSAKIIFMDSIQIFAKNYGNQFYYDLKNEFAGKKLFIFVSQADGSEPRGTIGEDVKYDANVKMRVEGGKLTSQSRIRGSKHGAHVIVHEQLYNEYWNN